MMPAMTPEEQVKETQRIIEERVRLAKEDGLPKIEGEISTP